LKKGGGGGRRGMKKGKIFQRKNSRVLRSSFESEARAEVKPPTFSRGEENFSSEDEH
jgi:hypothetical protein